ncbi:MAG: hypothetical protein L3J39_19670 [Verrucomicrobiales bacterium]|nr:hypothetical protein [Verrucomicrobiales bacterium]
MTIEMLTEFFGWITIINMGLLMFTTVMILILKGVVIKIHSKMFGIVEQDLNRMYFEYLGRFKILVIVFNLTPYIALKIIS